VVLENIKEAVGSSLTRMADELKQYGDISMREFIEKAALEIEDLYQTKNWYWTKIRRRADLPVDDTGPNEAEFGGRLHRILHIEDAKRLSFYTNIFEKERSPSAREWDSINRKQLHMIHYALWGDTPKSRKRWPDLESIISYFWEHPVIREELVDLLNYLDQEAQHLTYPLWDEYKWASDIPLEVHAKYGVVQTRFTLLNNFTG